VPLNFQERVFTITNELDGKMPTHMKEWEAVGIWSTNNVFSPQIRMLGPTV
tara:strand:- start:233 stop:385 length:153 start_codon:yes stop_codon:yes gene_type:complete